MRRWSTVRRWQKHILRNTQLLMYMYVVNGSVLARPCTFMSILGECLTLMSSGNNPTCHVPEVRVIYMYDLSINHGVVYRSHTIITPATKQAHQTIDCKFQANLLWCVVQICSQIKTTTKLMKTMHATLKVLIYLMRIVAPY